MKFISDIFAKRAEKKSKREEENQAIKEFKSKFDDGHIVAFDAMPEAEMSELSAYMSQLIALPDRIKLFDKVVNVVVNDYVVTEQECAKVIKAVHILNLPTEWIAEQLKEVNTLSNAHRIATGLNGPVVPSRAILKKSEIAAVEVSATLMGTERTRVYQGGSRGMSFRVAKGVSFRVGAHRGTSHSVENEIEVASGELVITNRRVIFTGDQKSFAFNMDKLLSFDLGLDEVIFHLENRVKPHYLRLFGNDAYLLSAGMTWAANQEA